MSTRQIGTALAAVLCATLALSPATVRAKKDDLVKNKHSCLPDIEQAFEASPVYAALFGTLSAQVDPIRTLLEAVVDQITYVALLTKAEQVAASVPSGRVVITLPDGTVVVDTAQTDDPGNVLPVGNSFAHFQSKTVNENHNTRVAILTAQLFPCGVGLERKLSTTTGFAESYFAIRLGDHLDNAGTARLSTTQ